MRSTSVIAYASCRPSLQAIKATRVDQNMPYEDYDSDWVDEGDYTALCAYLEKYPEFVQFRNTLNDQVLHSACHAKQPSLVWMILERRPDVNAKGAHGYTPLHYAVSGGDALTPLLVQFLLAAGAIPNIRDDFGRTPADVAKIEMSDHLRETLRLLTLAGNEQRLKPQ